MSTTLRRAIGLLTGVMCVAAAHPAFACPVCFGASDSPTVQGMRMAIVALLVATAGVLGAFGTFFVYLMRRARACEAPQAVAEQAQRGSY